MLTTVRALSQAGNESWFSIAFTMTDVAAWALARKLGLFLIKVMFVHSLLRSRCSVLSAGSRRGSGASQKPVLPVLAWPRLKFILIYSRAAAAMALPPATRPVHRENF